MARKGKGGRVATAKLWTETHGNNLSTGWPCAICGKEFTLDAMTVILVQDDLSWGDICPRCVQAGPAKAAESMRQYAERTRERAAKLLKEADEMEQAANCLPAATPWVTFDQWRADLRQYYCHDRGLTGDALREWEAEMDAEKAELQGVTHG